MIKKSDTVREAVQKQDWKKALQIAKDFHIGVTQEQRSKMARAYECIVHPNFYRQIGIDIPEAVEQGKAIVKEYVESARRKNTMMKWDVKHDRAKRVIDAFLENAVYWQDREDLSVGLTGEDKELVNAEVALMIASIRKRYKLQERLSEPEAAKITPATEQAQEAALEQVMEDKPEEQEEDKTEPEKSKRGRKAPIGEKKTASRRKKKEIQDEEV
jgi:hypothetical protein